MELHKENNPREQSRHSDWNPDRGSRNKILRGRQSAGDYGADGDEHGSDIGCLALLEMGLPNRFHQVIESFSA